MNVTAKDRESARALARTFYDVESPEARDKAEEGIAYRLAAEREWAGHRMSHDEIAEIAFEVIRTCQERDIADPLRLAHAVAVAIKLADLTADPTGGRPLHVWPQGDGEDWADPTPEQIAATAAYDPDPEQYGTAES